MLKVIVKLGLFDRQVETLTIELGFSDRACPLFLSV